MGRGSNRTRYITSQPKKETNDDKSSRNSHYTYLHASYEHNANFNFVTNNGMALAKIAHKIWLQTKNKRSLKCLEVLLKHQFNYNTSGLLNAACAVKDIELVKLILEHGFYIQKILEQAPHCLLVAYKNKYYDILKLLLKHGANPNTGLYKEHTCYNTKNTPKIRAFKQSPVYIAVEMNKPDIIELFKQYEDKLEINARTHEGKTALFRAAETGKLQCAYQLLQFKNIDEDSACNFNTALTIASKNNYRNMIQVLWGRKHYRPETYKKLREKIITAMEKEKITFKQTVQKYVPSQ